MFKFLPQNDLVSYLQGTLIRDGDKQSRRESGRTSIKGRDHFKKNDEGLGGEGGEQGSRPHTFHYNTSLTSPQVMMFLP